ncbi:TolC family protein, partial [Enterococcus lactis]
DAAGFDEKAAHGQRLPKLQLFAGTSYYNYLDSLQVSGFGVQQSGNAAQGGVQLSLPLYQGGRPSAQIRQARDRRTQAIE